MLKESLLRVCELRVVLDSTSASVTSKSALELVRIHLCNEWIVIVGVCVYAYKGHKPTGF